MGRRFGKAIGRTARFRWSFPYQSWSVKKLATPVSAAAQVAILQATAASAMTTAASESDYTFDKATGYYRHKTTGILYDANTGLFFNAITNAWYSWNETTQEYTQVGSKSVVESPPKEEDRAPARRRHVILGAEARTVRLEGGRKSRHELP